MEKWDLYTNKRILTDKTMLRGEKVPIGYYRIVVHVCIFNNNDEMLIQQRQPFKKGWSNMWDISVGGSAISGETSSDSAQREIMEELGLKVNLSDVAPNITIGFDGGFDDIFLITMDIDETMLSLQKEEVQAVKWADKTKILEMINDKTFIPYHKSMIELLFFLKDHKETRTSKDFTGKEEYNALQLPNN